MLMKSGKDRVSVRVSIELKFKKEGERETDLVKWIYKETKVMGRTS